MVTLLITAVTLLVLFAVGVYFWQKPSNDYSVKVPPPPPNAHSLFAEDAAALAEIDGPPLGSKLREDLISKAAEADRSALVDAQHLGDTALYDQAMNELVRVSDSDAKLLALMSYVSQNQLPVTPGLAKAALASWERSPDRNGTARALHCAALSDDPGLYCQAVETALHLWRESKLGDVSPLELRALFDGEFWVLSSRSRSSGAGFVLKRTLDSARRELEAAGARQ